MKDVRVISTPVHRVRHTKSILELDALAVEEPLEIQLDYEIDAQRVQRPISITMRTPGDDAALALGFLFTEGIIPGMNAVEAVTPGEATGCGKCNHITVTLKPNVPLHLNRLERHFYTTSSCGVCGKSSLAALHTLAPADAVQPLGLPPADILHALPERLADAQTVFNRTGGLHAAALFDLDGNLLMHCEDVGRHNALDKLVGHHVQAGTLPLRDRMLLLSGRASFELLQKAIIAGLSIVAAVGAPSSLAVELARSFGVTLLGFVRAGRYNVYTGLDVAPAYTLPTL